MIVPDGDEMETHDQTEKTEWVPCPLCGDDSNQPYQFESPACFKGNVKLGLNRCAVCSMQYISPRLNKAGLEWLYNTAYMTDTVSGPHSTNPEVAENEYAAFHRYVTQKLPSGGLLLDVGCGSGRFLQTFRPDDNIELEGLEYSKVMADLATEAGLNVVTADFAEWEYPENHYDCVTLLYVLEHVPDPRKVLNKVYSIVKRGGYVMIAVPNYRYMRIVADNRIVRSLRSGASPLHSEEHLQNFAPPTLKRLVAECGFNSHEWHCAQPLHTGSKAVVAMKWAAYLVVKSLFKLGYHLGGIHLIAQKPHNP
jgi:2-polyprenyl-3-methyl-5-hydroxy-6-metoxy-1,4-benzoquinol methylase